MDFQQLSHHKQQLLAAAGVERMANFSIRNVDETVASLLRKRAAANGVSMEEEARRILRSAVTAPTNIADLALGLFGPEHGVDLELPEHVSHEPPEFA